MVDNGSKVNLLPYWVFQQMRVPKEQFIRLQSKESEAPQWQLKGR